MLELKDTGEKFSTMDQELVTVGRDECAIEFDIICREGRDTSYVVTWSTGDDVYCCENISIGDKCKYHYVHRLSLKIVKEGHVHLSIYKEGDPTPFEQAVYYMSFGANW